MIRLHLPLDLDLLPETKGVYLVGGTTRDLLLGRIPVDYDIAVFQNPEIFAAMIAARSRGRLVRMGRPGKRSYRVVAEKMVLDIIGVSGPTIRQDLNRRDVTINAMAIEVASGTLLDWVGGQRDLSEKRIRMVSEKGLRDDPVRLLRVFRLAAALGFQIEKATLSAVSKHADMIHFSAGERIRAELYQLLSSRHSAPHIAAMAETGLLSAVLPESAPKPVQIHSDAFESPSRLDSLSAYKHLEDLLNHSPPGFKVKTKKSGLPAFPDRAVWQKFAMLIPPGATGSADPAESACGRLRLSTKERAFVTGIVRHTPRLFQLYDSYVKKTLTPGTVTRFFMAVESLAPHLLLHGLAKAQNEDQTMDPTLFSDFVRHMLQAYRETYLPRKARDPLVTGRDLLTIFGLTPSPLFKKILTRLEEGRLSGEIADRESSLDFAAKMIQQFKTQ